MLNYVQNPILNYSTVEKHVYIGQRVGQWMYSKGTLKLK